MNEIELMELQWNGDGVVAAWGHHDLHEFALAAVPWAGRDAACFEGQHLYVRNLGELNGYDEWLESCEAGDDGALAITIEVI